MKKHPSPVAIALAARFAPKPQVPEVIGASIEDATPPPITATQPPVHEPE